MENTLYSVVAIFIIVIIVPCEARTIFVDNSLDGDAYNTLAEAAAVAVAGDMVLIRAGTYNERLIPANSGSVGDYITFENYGNEAAIINTGSSIAIDISNRSYIIIDGLNIDDCRWLEAENSHYNIIRNNTFADTPATGTTGNLRFISSNYNKILNNVISNGNDNLLLINSDRNLVEGNTIAEGRHSIWGIRCGNYNIVRNNYFSNTQQKIGEVYDCGDDTYHVPNAFDSTKHNLITGNIFAGTVSYYSTSGGNGIQYAGQNGIVRRNIFYSNNVGLGMQIYGDEALYNNHNRIYHNVFYDNGCAGIASSSGTIDNIYKNNILFWNKGVSGDCFGTGSAQIVYRGSLGGYLFERNDILNQSAGENVIHQLFGSGNSLTYFESHYPSLFYDNLEVAPGFVDAPNLDFDLKPTSPMRDAGAFLTTTVGTGSGTVMQVVDAGYFYDGFDIDGEQGDLIQLAGDSATVRIVDVDYDTNMLTLDASLSWSVRYEYADSRCVLELVCWSRSGLGL